MTRRLPLLLIFALLLLTSTAFAGDFVIVPGQRIGTVALGMDRTSVHTLLHKPSTTHMAHGIVIDTWLSHRLLKFYEGGKGALKHDYLTVFFQRSHVVQIEVSAAKFKTASGLSTRSSANDFAKCYPNCQPSSFAPDASIHLVSVNPYVDYGVTGDPNYSSPAGKHFSSYGDAMKQGIAWKYDAWGDAAPDTDPSGGLAAVIVHVPGKHVLLNPNDGRPFSGTGPAR
ncbi:MAG: hypothetical protein ACRYFS_14510 [Janthinobacterium lividum]